MTDESSHDSHRTHFWRIGRLVCGVVAAIGFMTAVSADVSAQTPPVAVTQNPVPDAASPSGGKLDAECGLRVVLVLDESSSISAADVTRTREAANAFVDALKDTGSPLAITSFAIGARQLIGYNDVNDDTLQSFRNAINAFATNVPFGGRGGTNWQDAFRLVNTYTPAANLVVFMTDGNPNTTGQPSGTGSSAGTTFHGENVNGWTAATPASITAANSVKARQSRIFAMGVGAAVSDTNSQQRLQWISGHSEFGTGPNPNPDFATSDWTRVSDFTALKTALTGIVASLCGSRLIINKKVLDHNGNPVSASGWSFTAHVNSPGHTWLAPARADNGSTTGPSATLTTGADGRVEFQWRLHTASTATVSVTHEKEKNGFHFVSAQCVIHHANGESDNQPINTEKIPAAALKRLEWQTCEVLNEQTTARLTVIKRLKPSDDTGRFNLLIGTQVKRANAGNNQGTGAITLPLGTHTVSETGGTEADGTPTNLADYDTSIKCIDLANKDNVVASGPGPSLSVNLTKRDQNIECIITNTSTKFGDITVEKHLVPDTAPGAFDLFIGSALVKAGARDGDSGQRTGLPFGAYTVNEDIAAGQSVTLANFNIHTTCIDQSGATVFDEPGPAATVTLSRDHTSITCLITNEHIPPPPKPAHLTVVKQLVPADDPGAFNLLVDGTPWAFAVGDGGRTAPLEFEAPATAKVSEQGVNGTHLGDYSISTTCKAGGGHGHTVAHGTGPDAVAVHLREDANVVCTITNSRNEPPGGGGGKLPDLPAGPSLAVAKTMPLHARVGQLVRITITVHNHGDATAHGVQLHENRPAGLQIISVANHGRIQNGTAVWHLGDIGPGASRTVHATARVLRTGLHVDTAVATAINADPALSNAAVRAAAAVRPPPPPPPPPPVVTG